MPKLLNISEAASLALHTMTLLAGNGGKVLTTARMASGLGVSEAHLAKVMQRLGRAGLVNSQRGPGGGFTLARPPERITLLEVYEAMEGPLQVTSCLLPEPICGGNCILSDLLPGVSQKFKDHLTQTTLDKLSNVYLGANDEETA